MRNIAPATISAVMDRTTAAATPVGKDRFSVLGKVSPVIKDAVRAAKMKKATSCFLPFWNSVSYLCFQADAEYEFVGLGDRIGLFSLTRDHAQADPRTLADFSIRIVLGSVLRDLLNPLIPPTWRLKGICEILRFVDYFTVAEFHDAYRVR